jgi:hypothetical protein
MPQQKSWMQTNQLVVWFYPLITFFVSDPAYNISFLISENQIQAKQATPAY